ncbi:GTP cyclohydrolase I FolE [bacterium]|nr:GTP cyclohydrolase I FolE [bacterium]
MLGNKQKNRRARRSSNAQNKELEIMDNQKIQALWKELLSAIGEDPSREGLLDTPKRVSKAYSKLFGGYDQSPEQVLSTTFAEGSCDEMVILKNIEFYSMCEHHVLPFSGVISIGYIPNKKVVGVSKLARLVEVFARRMQIQERLTSQIADTIMTVLDAKGVIVTAKAQHLCMTARGVEKQKSEMITSAVRGVFKENQGARQEFLSLVSQLDS